MDYKTSTAVLALHKKAKPFASRGLDLSEA